jgi:hypothetical protein
VETLRELARRAVAEVDPAAASRKIQAMKLCRDYDGARHTLAEYARAVDWVLARPNAGDLPDGSVVASPTVAFIKDHRVPDRPWSCTDGGHAPDEEIDGYLGLNARVLRVGTGEDAR